MHAVKDFESWSLLKKKTHEEGSGTIPYFREGDIWWCKLGVNVGDEQDGKGGSFSRPVLVLKKFNQFLFWCVPLSKVLKENPYYFFVECSDGVTRAAMISQLRLVSSKRLTDKVGYVKDGAVSETKKAIKALL